MHDDADERCPECGAQVPPGADCRSNLHALLALESEIPGGPGLLPHFYLVATYGLQHPAGMGHTQETADGLVSAVCDALEGRATIEDLRRRARYAAKQAGRVTRRGDEPVPDWQVDRWPMVATDVLAGGVDGYGARVERWARSVITAIAK